MVDIDNMNPASGRVIKENGEIINIIDNGLLIGDGQGNFITFDLTTGTRMKVESIGHNHNEVHKSNMERTLQIEPLVSENDSLSFHLKIPAGKEIHVKAINAWCEEIGQLKVTVNGIVTDGNQQLIFNNLKQSSNPSAGVITGFNNSVYVSGGNILLNDYFGGGGRSNSKVGGGFSIAEELIIGDLNNATNVLIETISRSSSDMKMSTSVEWYTETINE